MTSHVCDYCGQEWRSPISAALCCDPISNDLDSDPVTIIRGAD